MGDLELARKYTHHTNKPDQVRDSAMGHGLFLLLALCALTDLPIPGLNWSGFPMGPGSLVFLIFSLCQSILLPLLSVRCQWGSLYEKPTFFWSISIYVHRFRFPELQRPLSESIRTVSLKMKQRASHLWSLKQIRLLVLLDRTMDPFQGFFQKISSSAPNLIHELWKCYCYCPFRGIGFAPILNLLK